MVNKYDYDLAKNLITNFTTVSLNDTINYTTTSTVGNTQIKLTFGYNSFNKNRWVIINDVDGNILLPQTFLAYGRRCELNFNAEINNLHYYVTLRLIDKSKDRIVSNKDYDYQYWSKDLVLCFIGFEQDLWEQIGSNYVLYLTGEV